MKIPVNKTIFMCWGIPFLCLCFSSVQFSRSVMSDSLRPHESQHRQASLSITNSRSSLRVASIKSVMPSSHLILGRPLLLLPPIPPSIKVFSNESTHHWPKKMDQWLKSGVDENCHANTVTQDNTFNIKNRFKDKWREVMQYMLGEVKIWLWWSS